MNAFKSLYISLIRSRSEYCSPVWSPHCKYQCENLERVQKSFLKYLCFKSGTNYGDLGYDGACVHFNLPPLSKRRSVLDVSCLHGLISGKYHCSYLLSQLPFYVPRRTLRTPILFYVPNARINLRKFSFVPRVTRAYNSFTTNPHVDIFMSASSFKTAVSRHFYNTL